MNEYPFPISSVIVCHFLLIFLIAKGFVELEFLFGDLNLTGKFFLLVFFL